MVMDRPFDQPPELEPADGRETSLHEAIRSLTSELSLEMVLQKVADLSRELVSASYSALGMVGADGRLVRFITSGISQRGRDRIGRIPEGKGVLGVVLREGRPLRLADLTQYSESVGFPPYHPVMKSFLGVPIVFNGRVVGDLYLANKIGAAEFSQDDETIVTLFAAQAAVAMENARLFEDESRRSAQLDVLNQIGRELNRIIDLDNLLRTVAELVQRGFEYQNVQIYWVDVGTGEMRIRALVGPIFGKMPLGSSLPIGKGIAGWVAENKQTLVSNDVSQDPRYVAEPGFETAAEAAVPVIVKGDVVAVINVESMEPHAFDESDVKTLETLADQLSVAIENIQLYDRQRDQARRLAIAEERDRIGKDLHDGVIQSIYAVGLTLEDIAAQSAANPGQVASRVEEVVTDLNTVIGDIRSYIMDLRPRELQGRGLDEALRSSASDLEDRTGASVELGIGLDLLRLSETDVVNIWHMVQEAFSNIEKYARATKVSVDLAVRDGYLVLQIADDGVGFDPQKVELGKGYGLSNIKERAERLGGVLILESSPGNGARLLAQIPMREQQPVSQY